MRARCQGLERRPISLWGPNIFSRSLRRRRRDVGDFVHLGRQRGPGAISANGPPASAHPIAFAAASARRYFRISSARACMVASGSSASNSVIIITRCRCGAALPWSGVLAGMASLRPDWLSGSAQGLAGASPFAALCGPTSNLYPTPGTERMNRGVFGSGSILRRRRATSISTLRS